MADYQIRDDVPIHVSQRETRLRLAQSIYNDGDFGKSTAAKMAIDELGLWRNAVYQSAVDYLRQRIVAK